MSHPKKNFFLFIVKEQKEMSEVKREATVYRVFCVDRPELFFIGGTFDPLEVQLEKHILNSFDLKSKLRLDQEMRARGYRKWKIQAEFPSTARTPEVLEGVVEGAKNTLLPTLNDSLSGVPTLSTEERKKLAQRKADFKRRNKQKEKAALLNQRVREKRKADETFDAEYKEKNREAQKKHYSKVQNDPDSLEHANRKQKEYREKRREQGKDLSSVLVTSRVTRGPDSISWGIKSLVYQPMSSDSFLLEILNKRKR